MTVMQILRGILVNLVKQLDQLRIRQKKDSELANGTENNVTSSFFKDLIYIAVLDVSDNLY